MLLFGTLYWRTGAGTPDPTPPPPDPVVDQPKGRAAWLGDYSDPRRSEADVRKARERFGIPDEVRIALEEVARRQAERLELDRQKQYDELARELELKKIDMRGEYLEALAEERQKLIDAEIGRRLRQKMEEEVVILIMMAAAATL